MEYKADAVEVLDLIHNGKLGRPIILLAEGIGDLRPYMLHHSRNTEEMEKELALIRVDG